jgi:hypothetical protein
MRLNCGALISPCLPPSPLSKAIPFLRKKVLGSRASPVAVLQNDVALTIPLRSISSSDSDVKANNQSLRRERNVYGRLQDLEDERSDGVVRCIGFLSEAAQLAYISNGDLRAYLAKNRRSY